MNEKLSAFGVVPVVVIDDAKDALPLAEALRAGGLLCAEVTFRTDAAEESIKNHLDVEIAVDLGAGTYLSRHVLILRDKNAVGIKPGMKVAYDRTSLDQRDITGQITAGISGIQFVELRAHQTVTAIREGIIDAGVWNVDEIVESGYRDLHMVFLDNILDVSSFSSAVLVIRRGEEALGQLLRRYVKPEEVREIQKGVKSGTIPADY